MVKIGSRVVEFGALMVIGTAAALGLSKLMSPSEEDKERVLRERYPDLVKQSEGNKKNMQAFFNTLKSDPNDPEAQKRFDDLLRGGKGEVKNQSSNRGVVIDPSSVGDPNKLKEKIGKK
jgi:hypothetical protein